MQALFVEQDLFICLVQQCAVDDLENLYTCNSTIKELLSSPFILSILSARFAIKKTFTSLYYFLQEYNHRFCREKCPEQDLDVHLLWAVKDGDTQTLKEILENYPYTTDRWGDSKEFYELYFQAGCRGDYTSFKLLKKKGLRIRGINQTSIFIAGLAYAGQTEFPRPVCTSLPDLRLILHEAMRGGHPLQNDLLKPHSMAALAYAAADNVEKLLPLLDYDWKYEDISFYGEQYFGWNKEEFSKRDMLIACALYHQSWKVLDLLTKNYTLPEFFKGFPFSDFDVQSYRRVSKHLQFTNKENKNILWSAACTNNLPLVKELKRHINVNQPPSWFTEMVEGNAYKVCKWMLKQYKFSLAGLEFAGDDNYTYRLVQAYIENS